MSGVQSVLVPPTSIQLEVTSKCNLRCVTCLSRNDEVKSDMSPKLFKSIIDQFNGPRSKRVALFGLGEPLMNPHIVSMVRYCKARGLNVGFNSNFTLMNRNFANDLIEAELDWVHVSYDGATKQTFEKIRVGADFDKVTENVRLLIKTRDEYKSSTPRIVLQSTISEHNRKEIPDLAKAAESLRVDEILFVPGILVQGYQPIVSELNSLNGKMSGKSTSISFAVPGRAKSCTRALSRCYVTCDGEVLQCSSHMEMLPRKLYSSCSFGNLNNATLGHIWFSKRYRKIRLRMALGYYPQVCRDCNHQQ